MGKQPDIGWVPEETRHYHGLFVDTKLVNNLCSFIFFALQILKNEAPQEVKSDEKLFDFRLVLSFMEIPAYFLYN